MRAAICEDEIIILRSIKEHIRRGLESLDVACTLNAYTAPSELLEQISAGAEIDVFFLDIEMPGLDGIELSKKIRFYLPNALIIFISNKEELVFQTFEVRPFRFIRKNHLKEELPTVLKDIKRELSLEKGSTVTIEEPGGKIISFALDDIIYVEAMLKECVIHRKTDEIRCKYKFSDLLKLLEPYHFVQTHRSYAINAKYIFRINSDTILLDNNDSIPLGRTHRDNVKKAFMSYAKSI